MVALALMVVGAGFAVHMRDMRASVPVHLIVVGAMVEGMWEERILAPVWWLALGIVGACGASLIRRVRKGRGSVNGATGTMMMLHQVGGILMCALMMPAGGSGLPVVSGHAHHVGTDFGLAAVTAVFGIGCVAVGAGLARRRAPWMAVADVLANAGALLVMAASFALSL